jgi:PTS system nitrogen regulatory IIA component
MKLYDVLREECICVGLEAADKPSALRLVAQCAKKSEILRDVDETAIFNGLCKREDLGSTGFGEGIAIPHCRLPEVSDFVVGFLTIPSGVEFDALDQKPVEIIVFIVAPEEVSNRHVRLLSAISQALYGKKAVKEIVAAQTSEAARDSFLRHARGELELEGHAGKRMVCVFVQDEQLFHDLLEILVGMENSSTMVIASDNLRSHVSKVPLFQGLWSHEPGGFSQIIVSVLEKGLTNELVRSIATRTGDLDKRNDVMITMQDILYVAGSLST